MSALLQFREALPLSLYIHLPWCIRKCPYCDFNSHGINDDVIPETEYIAALIRDLEFELPRIWGRRISSIFIGGGTPSLFSGSSINDLLCALHARLNFNPDIEITLEANPGTIDSDHFREYRTAGVNRLSIGVQSFSDDKLAALGRIHNVSQSLQAIEMARTSGFDNINIDLMYGLPGQTIDESIHDLQIAIGCEPDHISWYQLTIEPNTVFYSHPPQLPDDDLIWEMHIAGQQSLKEQGYKQYEVSAYAKEKHQCRHNLNYWQFGDYLGIGAGAHGKLTDVSQNQIRRFARHRIPATYMHQAGTSDAIVTEKKLTLPDIPLEFMLNALRLTDGFSAQLFLQRCGMPLHKIKEPLTQAEQQGFIEWSVERITPADKGQRYLNDLLQLFMSDDFKSMQPTPL